MYGIRPSSTPDLDDYLVVLSNRACSACAATDFIADDGVCTPCPVRTSAWQQYSGLIYIGVAVIAFVLVVYALLAAIVCVQVSGQISVY